MRILFLGDTHGDASWVSYAIEKAKEQRCDVIMQVGDFGYWEHTAKGQRFLDLVEVLLQGGPLLYWIDGNHENHTMLREKYKVQLPGQDTVAIRRNLWYAPRGYRWEWDGVSFLGLGGAYSIDKNYRIPGASWWPEECITDWEASIAMHGGPVDVMVTHDAPIQVETPWDPSGSIDRRKDLWPESRANREMLTRVFDEVKPKLLVHGHYHNTYMATVGDSMIRGLGCDGDPSSLLVVDTDALYEGYVP